jgi:hypothetical protein
MRQEGISDPYHSIHNILGMDEENRHVGCNVVRMKKDGVV